MNLDILTSLIAGLFSALVAFGLASDRRNHGEHYWLALAIVTVTVCVLAAAGIVAEVWRFIRGS
jgi:hypothetical protein